MHEGGSDLTKDHPMLNRLLSVILAISIAAPVIAVQAKDALVLKTVNVVLPTSDRMFPDGPGSDVVNSYCLVCHSAAMVLSQPTMTRSAWEAEVQKMRTAYKAPIPEEQIQTIVLYLAALQNAK
jgi:cytochrome c5